MRIGHFTPSYTPITPGLTAQTHREAATLTEKLNYSYEWWEESCSDIVKIRNRAIKRSIDECHNYLCMQDSDIYSKSSIGVIAPMLATALETGAAMVAAICGLRRTPPCSNVEPSRPGQVYTAEKAGTGIVLIDVGQVSKIWGTRRLFDKSYNEDGTEIEVGEDIWFCRVLRDAGLSIYVDGRVPTTHVQVDRTTLDYPGANANASASHGALLSA
jgi:hypothetical protein